MTKAVSESAAPGRSMLLMLATLSFLVSVSMQIALYDLAVLQQWDAMFDADTRRYVSSFTGVPEFVSRHPTFTYAVASITRSLAKLTALFVDAGPDQRALRMWWVMVLFAGAAGLRTAFTYATLHRILQRDRVAALLTVLDIAAFSSITLASVPESFPVSATCIAIMCWLLFRGPVQSLRWHCVWWFAVSAVAIGTTLSNALSIAPLLLLDLARRGIRPGRALLLSAALGVSAIIANIAAFPSIIWAYRNLSRRGVMDGLTTQAGHMITPMGVRELGWSFAHTYLAPTPVAEPVLANIGKNADYVARFIFTPPYAHGFPSAWRGALTLALLLVGLVGLVRSRRSDVLAPALAILSANIGLHLFWGSTYFLYAMHWQMALLLLLAGVATVSTTRWRVGEGVLVGFTLLTACNSAWLVAGMFNVLRKA